MANSSDVEEAIPPTPNIQHNKFCSRIEKNSITSTKLSKKLSKTDQNRCKRKRIISPEKKVKQRVKQVTLMNFLIKNKKSSDVSSKTDPLSTLESSVRVNLESKFDIKSDQYGSAISAASSIKKVPCAESENALSICESETKICDEVSLLHLDSSNEHIETNLDLNLRLNPCDSDNKNMEPCSKFCNGENVESSNKLLTAASNEDVIMNLCVSETEGVVLEKNTLYDKKPISVDQSFSWISDIEWNKNKENFEFSFNFADESMMSNDSDMSSSNKDTHMKFKVREVKKDSSKNEIKLIVGVKDETSVKNCTLRGFWADTIVGIGDTVHILKPSNSRETIIDNDSGFFVVNPDFLISSTAVVSTLFCMRKAALNHILPQWSPGNNIMMIGSLVHDIFQKSVNNHACTPGDILKIVKLVMKKRENLIALCCQDMSESEIEEKICKYIPNIISWMSKYCNYEGRNTFESISVTKVEDIEENMWCPKYGIKGKIDMTVSCQNVGTSMTMPLELKTGRHTFSAEHVGQVNLYSLMMEERSKETSDGLLLYLRDKAEMKVIKTNHNSKRGLIQLRNELVSYVFKWTSSKRSNYEDIEECYLPQPINNKRLCEKCPYILPCTLYQKAFSEENKLEPSHTMKKLVPLSTNHLSTNYVEYFLHWSRLLLLENTTTAEIKAFWTEDAVKREKQGMCVSFVLLDENVAVKQEDLCDFFLHTFIRSTNNPLSSDFKNCCLKAGDYVAISNQDNPDEVAVAMGYIIRISDQRIEFASDRNLKAITRLNGLTFRIDKQVSNSAAACVRNNLMLLMQNEDQADKLRKLIIDKESPKFLQVLPKQIVLMGRSILKCLNKNQQKAVLKALMAEDYFLIKGMPGTGKTSTIVALVRLLVQMNVSVLLTSYTHSAIDNILLKLKEHTDFMRIGPKYRIHPEILKYSFENLTQDFSSADQYSSFMKKKLVVATTCLSVNHAIFKLRKFDVCIVDEASQINQIACLGPLFFAKKFILVGDEKQLPPLVLNNEARQRGMQESLFQRLQTPSNCIELNIQYRMNKEIMRLCNELTYNGSLQCGSEFVAKNVLSLPKETVAADKNYPSWLNLAFDADISKSVLFMNTDVCEDKKSENRNDTEADLVTMLVQFLLEHKVQNLDVGIIAPYRKQVDLIETKLKSLSIFGIEVNTVDQYQGRDKDVIIISCARPNDSESKEEKVGVILADEKRLNVAISRARKKLILIGSKTNLSLYKPFKDFISCLKEDQFMDVT